jgi:hypothetical protein
VLVEERRVVRQWSAHAEDASVREACCGEGLADSRAFGGAGYVEVFEARVVGEVGQLDRAGGAVALLGDDDLGFALEVFVFAVVVLLAVDEADDVGVLLDRAGLAQVGEQRLLVAGALLAAARELRERDDGHLHLFGERLQAARDAETSWVRFSKPFLRCRPVPVMSCR